MGQAIGEIRPVAVISAPALVLLHGHGFRTLSEGATQDRSHLTPVPIHTLWIILRSYEGPRRVTRRLLW